MAWWEDRPAVADKIQARKARRTSGSGPWVPEFNAGTPTLAGPGVTGRDAKLQNLERLGGLDGGGISRARTDAAARFQDIERRHLAGDTSVSAEDVERSRSEWRMNSLGHILQGMSLPDDASPRMRQLKRNYYREDGGQGSLDRPMEPAGPSPLRGSSPSYGWNRTRAQQPFYNTPRTATYGARYSPRSATPAVPYDQRTASAPIAFSGPGSVGYRGQRVDPSRTFSFDPESGQYYRAQTDFRNDLPTIDQFRPDINAVERATFQRALNRIDPYLQEQRSGISQRLANQGLAVGSEAYQNELNRFDRGRGDQLENLALSAVGAGRQEHGRLTGLAQSLRGQEFGEGMASRQFDSGEAARQFSERLTGTDFNAREAGRGFQERLASEGQFFNQGLAADQFGANQAQRRDQQGIQQQQFGDTFNAGERRFGANQAGVDRRFADSFGAQGQQFGAGLNQADRQFEADFGLRQQGQFFNQGLARDQFGLQQQGQQFGQGLARDQFGLQQQGQGFNQGLADRQFGLGQQGQFFGQGLARDQFGLQQQGQQFNQGFANRGQQFGQGLARDQFGLGQQGQFFNQGLQNRQQGFSEQQWNQQFPINSLAQILGMTNVGQPGFQQTPTYGPMPVDYTGNYRFESSRPNPFLQAIGGVASAVAPWATGFLPQPG